MDESEDLVNGLIERGIGFDGIAASSDHAAIGALNALRAAGIDVPGQVKVAGFDDSLYTRLLTPQLTSVHRFPEKMAEVGCRTLLALLRGEKPAREAVIPVELVARASTE